MGIQTRLDAGLPPCDNSSQFQRAGFWLRSITSAKPLENASAGFFRLVMTAFFCPSENYSRRWREPVSSIAHE
jgi:hypothetical protein